jgi:hypothetical protein
MPIQNYGAAISILVSIEHAADNGGIVIKAPKGAINFSSKASIPAMGPIAQMGSAAGS